MNLSPEYYSAEKPIFFDPLFRRGTDENKKYYLLSEYHIFISSKQLPLSENQSAL